MDTGANITYNVNNWINIFMKIQFPSPIGYGLHSLAWEGIIRDNCKFPMNTPFSIRKNMGVHYKSCLKVFYFILF